jgi:hypothetical protein
VSHGREHSRCEESRVHQQLLRGTASGGEHTLVYLQALSRMSRTAIQKIP